MHRDVFFSHFIRVNYYISLKGHFLLLGKMTSGSVVPIGMAFFSTISINSCEPPSSGCKQVPWPIRSGMSWSKTFDSSTSGTYKKMYHSFYWTFLFTGQMVGVNVACQRKQLIFTVERAVHLQYLAAHCDDNSDSQTNLLCVWREF